MVTLTTRLIRFDRVGILLAVQNVHTMSPTWPSLIDHVQAALATVVSCRNGAAGVFDRHKGGLQLKENLKAGGSCAGACVLFICPFLHSNL